MGDGLPIEIERPLMDERDAMYCLGGQLLGTVWNHRDYGTVEVRRAQQNVTREQGERMSSPEIVLSNNKRLSVSGFVGLIKQGAVEPAGDLVAQVIANELK